MFSRKNFSHFTRVKRNQTDEFSVDVWKQVVMWQIWFLEEAVPDRGGCDDEDTITNWWWTKYEGDKTVNWKMVRSISGVRWCQVVFISEYVIMLVWKTNNLNPNRQQSHTCLSTRKFGQIFARQRARSTTTIFTHSGSFWTSKKQSTIIIIIIIHEFHRDTSLETKFQGRYVSHITLQL